MRPVSVEFLSAVRSSHQMRAEAVVVSGHQSGVNPVGTTIPIHDGDVVMDATADIRSTLAMATAPDLSQQGAPGSFPDLASDLLAPYGNEIFVRRGIEFGDRHVEWVSQGYFRIDHVSQDDAPHGDISITGSDRMAGIIDGRLEAPRQFSRSTALEDVFDTLITEIYPDAVIEFDTPLGNLGRKGVVERDRYAFLRDLATARGKQFYVDYRGVFVVQSPPDPAQPVFNVNAGTGGVLVSIAREISRDGIYNAVVAAGEGADDVKPVRGVARDLSKNSPTRWGGPFGKVPRFFSSPFITTVAQARDAAAKLLRDQLGLPFSLSFAAVPNPALEPHDPVGVSTPDRSYIHVLQQVTVPLTASQALTARTRDKTSEQIGLE